MHIVFPILGGFVAHALVLPKDSGDMTGKRPARLQALTSPLASPDAPVGSKNQLAPRPLNTLGIVRRMIFQSNASDQLSMYCMSIFIHVSKSMESRPATAHRQVKPGRIRNRRRCQR